MASTIQAQPSPQEIRRQINAYIMDTKGSVESVREVKDIRIPGPGGDLALRTYLPQGNGPFPLLVFMHGAGWVAGNLDTHDNVCRYLCNRVPCTGVSVAYRLAPESKFPAALNDAYAATVWAAKHAEQLNADSSRLAVAGDSSGANLAAAVCLIARNQAGPPIIFQLLVNPALDMTAYDAPGFENMKWFREQYLNGEQDYTRPYASPPFAHDLSGLPQALIITGEHDGLRDEGQRYATQLSQAGVFVNDYCQRGMGHLSAMYARANPGAREALDLSVVALRAALRKKGSPVSIA
jgi:acetyl esterase